MRERISYYSDGLKLTGILSTPDNSRGIHFPGVVLVPGFMSTADAFFPGFAEELNAAGFVSLTMDFRGFGESEGVRGEVIPYLQIYDASNAISYLQSRPEVNPDKIAVLGVSLGGGEVAYIAARDRRVKCVASMVLVGDGERRMRRFRTEQEWETLMQKVQEEKDELEADDADILYRKAKEPKKLFTLEGGVHFDVYGKRTNEAMKPVIEWFNQYLQ